MYNFWEALTDAYYIYEQHDLVDFARRSLQQEDALGLAVLSAHIEFRIVASRLIAARTLMPQLNQEQKEFLLHAETETSLREKLTYISDTCANLAEPHDKLAILAESTQLIDTLAELLDRFLGISEGSEISTK
jgi:hypothetical protein